MPTFFWKSIGMQKVCELWQIGKSYLEMGVARNVGVVASNVYNRYLLLCAFHLKTKADQSHKPLLASFQKE